MRVAIVESHHFTLEHARAHAAAVMTVGAGISHANSAFRVDLDKHIAAPASVGKQKTSMLQDVEAG
jgi:hypothetical protein